MSALKKDWVLLISIVCISITLSVITTLVIIDNQEQPQKIVVMDFARDLAMMVKDGRLTDDNQESILVDMIQQSESFAEQGYIVLNRSAVLATPDYSDFKYYEVK